MRACLQQQSHATTSGRSETMDLRSKLRQALTSLKGHPSTTTPAAHALLSGISAAVARSTDGHHDTPMDEKYVHEILFLVSNSPASATFLARRISHRLESARDRVTALKTLVLLHRLLRGGDRRFELDVRDLHASGDLRLDLRWFQQRDPAGFPSSFLRYYAEFLEERTRWAINQAGKLEPMEAAAADEVHDPVVVACRRVSRGQVFMDRVIGSCYHPTNLSRTVEKHAMGIILRESFKVYAALADDIDLILLHYSSSHHQRPPRRSPSKSVARAIRTAASQTRRLHEFYEACKGVLVAGKGLEYPQVRIVSAEEVLSKEKRVLVGGGDDCSDGVCERFFSSCGLETRISTEWVEFGGGEEETTTSTSSLSILGGAEEQWSAGSDAGGGEYYWECMRTDESMQLLL